MTISDEHFDVLREVREAAKDLQLACVEATGIGSLLHIAYDPLIQPTEERPRKLRMVR